MVDLFYLVEVSGFEPEVSWTRTKRDTKLRHTSMPSYYTQKLSVCQVLQKVFSLFTTCFLLCIHILNYRGDVSALQNHLRPGSRENGRGSFISPPVPAGRLPADVYHRRQIFMSGRYCDTSGIPYAQ